MSRKLDQNMENETMIKARTTNENNAQNYSEKENQILTKKVSEWAVFSLALSANEKATSRCVRVQVTQKDTKSLLALEWIGE